MAEISTAPVVAKRVDDVEEVAAAPGAFSFYTSNRVRGGRPAGMIYACPCGCGKTGALAFRPHPSPSWEWDGNREQPTLTPSVHHVGHWHGWLRGGVWTSI